MQVFVPPKLLPLRLRLMVFSVASIMGTILVCNWVLGSENNPHTMIGLTVGFIAGWITRRVAV